jgi:hypothetical protein
MVSVLGVPAEFVSPPQRNIRLGVVFLLKRFLFFLLRGKAGFGLYCVGQGQLLVWRRIQVEGALRFSLSISESDRLKV